MLFDSELHPMLESVRFHLALQKLFSEQDANHKRFDKLIKKARTEKASSEDLQDLYHEASFEDSLIRDSIDSTVTRYWIRQAQRKFIPIPERNEGDCWKRSDLDETWQLTPKGVSELRNAVRNEARDSREIWTIVGAGLTGAIGAATGLFAILKQ